MYITEIDILCNILICLPSLITKLLTTTNCVDLQEALLPTMVSHITLKKLIN